MMQKIKTAFRAAALGIGIAGTPLGVYWAGDAAVKEFVTRKIDHDAAKACLETVKKNSVCSEDDYKKVTLYVDTKKQYAMGLSWGFGGASLLRLGMPVVVAWRRKKPENKR